MPERRQALGTVVRAPDATDIDDVVELLTVASAYDNRPQLRRMLAAGAEGDTSRVWVAEREGDVVGAAALTEMPSLPGSVSARIAVRESERGQGLGTALADEVVAAVDARTGSGAVTCALRDDLPRGRLFAERYGLAVTNHNIGWSIDLCQSEEDLQKHLVRHTDRAAVRLRRADVDTESALVMAVASRCVIGFPVPFGTGRNVDMRSALNAVPRDATVFLAESDEEAGGPPRGLAVMAPGAGGTVWHTVFTGVDPDHRRRGVGSALKAAVLMEARRAGARVVTALSDEANEPITRLNRAIGMERTVGYWSLARALDAGAGTG
ncbi:GNAT family N-acetyltransferase [Streptomyces globisporus]|uniref:GNAT family N-acetyltransferase n=1 Tax=Streptomyces TaxID=1883 RepID=UPI000373B778|nr:MULTISPECIES: GNAT family N-acetyltransferase [unclassified Streptomyces]MYQ76697.1 GNAT family N-acetyltransferase [Streptomyces sp. SID4923]GGW16927.1 hypothetical protein GCM10010264_70630 [Streptomyces globisporus]